MGGMERRSSSGSGVAAELVVTAASSVRSGILQEASEAERPACLLRSTEAISSSRLYSVAHTDARGKNGTKARKGKQRRRAVTLCR